MSRWALPALLGLGGVAVVVGAVVPASRPSGSAGYRAEPVTAAETVCAPKIAGAVGDFAGADVGGGSGLITVLAAGKSILSPSPGTSFGVSAVTGPIVVSAAGSAAAGLSVARVQLIDAPGRIGYLLQPCPTPSAVSWFIGGHSTVGRSTVIEVVNPDPAPSQFSIDVYGPSGPIDTPGSHGLTLPGYGARQIMLTTLAPDLPISAFSVTATSGRVASTASDFSSQGLNSLGVTALPPTSPATSLLLAGIPAGVTKATLLLLPLASGTAQAQLLTATSAFVPVGGAGIGLNANQLTAIDLTPGLAGAAAALRLDSSVPVVAAVRYEFGSSITRRRITGRKTVLTVTTTISTAGEVVPAVGLTSPALLPGIWWDANTTVFLSALGRAGAVSLAAWPQGVAEPLAAQVIDVPVGRQVAVRVGGGRSGWWALVAQPVSGGEVSASVFSERTVAGVPSPSSVGMSPLRQILRLPAASFDVALSRP